MVRLGKCNDDIKNNPEVDEEIKYFAAGNKLATPPPGDEVVISGMSASLPDSDGVYQFRDNLYNKVDLVTKDNKRWEPICLEVPDRAAKINNLSKFDAAFFDVTYRQANSMDPQIRILLEKTFEAIVDAGINPKDLRGSKTGVFVGTSFSETETYLFFHKLREGYEPLTGSTRSMMANRVSYFFGFEGPSLTVDTACSSSLYAIEHAYRSIREGKCDSAIVAGVQLCLNMLVSLQFFRLGVLSKEGYCRCFDKNADGYARAEAVISIFLQKAKDSRRIYSNIVHVKTNCDGYKAEGINYPSRDGQRLLLKEFYEDCRINPSTVDYVEAHATATKVGDPEEVAVLDEIFCKDRKEPLYIGSVKSNMGHSEPCSGLCSIVKMLIAMENECIPPNLHYSEPREGIDALEQGRIKIITEKLPWPYKTGLVGINSFGFGGANGHLLLRMNEKKKSNNSNDNIPRLVCVSGRNERSVQSILDDIKSRSIDYEHVALLHEIFKDDIPGFKSRGFIILSKQGEMTRSVSNYDEFKKTFYFVFGTPQGSHWLDIGKEMFVLPRFAATIQRAHDILSRNKINDVTDVILNEKAIVEERVQLLACLVVQLGLIDLFKILNIEPDYLLGVGLGELSTAYYDKSLTLEQVLLAASSLLNLTWKEQNKIDVIVRDLEKIIPKKLNTSGKWITAQSNGSSVTPEYFVREFVKRGEVKNIGQHIAKNSVIVDVTDGKIHGNDFKSKTDEVFELFSPIQTGKYLENFLETVGRLFEQGINPKLNEIYPKIKYPVGKNTPMISPLLKWNHEADWFVNYYNMKNSNKIGRKQFILNFKEKELNFYTGHVIDGRNLFPATGYLCLVWETLAMMYNTIMSNMEVLFEDVRFVRATNIPDGGTLEMIVMIQKKSGIFEVTEGGALVVTGKVTNLEDSSLEMIKIEVPSGFPSESEISLQSKDIYKELRLRGYNYKDKFRALLSTDITTSRGIISWNGSYVTFIDNMLQMSILNVDTRSLYVPTGIDRLVINAKKHSKILEKKGDNPNIDVNYQKNANYIRSGGIEIRGLKANSIPRRKNLGEPVLETYKFLPNEMKLEILDSLSVNMQIILENSYSLKMKVVEIYEDGTLLSPIVQQVLGNQPLINPEIIILSEKQMPEVKITIENRPLDTETNCDLIVANEISDKQLLAEECLNSLKDGGFILSKEKSTFDPSSYVSKNLTLLTVHETEEEKLILLKKSGKEAPDFVTVKISNEQEETFDWLRNLQEARQKNKNLIVFSEKNDLSGILGLVNCIRNEPGGESVKCFFIAEENAPPFDINDEFYRKQLKKNFAVNVYMNQKWGTYRHLLVKETKLVEAEHACANPLVTGDLSSLKWIEGPLKKENGTDPESSEIRVYYAPLNFRDIMIATGRLTLEVVTNNRLQQMFLQGFEYSGRDLQGTRMMGITGQGALATMVAVDNSLSWRVPNEWTLEQAATVPVVYATALVAFYTGRPLKRGESVLIHAGSGGVGQAAIHIASYYGCEIFTTVGTKEKKDFLLQEFPHIKECRIGNSRDVSFEQMVLQETNGRGVDVVLNSLSEEKLLASVRCLAPGGRFLEIGKYDLAKNNRIPLLTLLDGRSYHGIFLDTLFYAEPEKKRDIQKLVDEHINNGSVKPLPTKVFEQNDVESAFRFMATGKHIGKVVIKIKEEEKNNNFQLVPDTKLCIPRYYCDPDKSYVILGGLGGFGLELADWLVIRGARKLVLSSRSGVTNGYQGLRIKTWTSYGVTVRISTENIFESKGCENILQTASRLGPVHGIFNLAVVLKDAILENQTDESFRISFGPKVNATRHLDKLTRKMCPKLRDFVVFSSVSTGRGNAGQTNYGMANSIMERICEKRKKEGFPALAIQWGAVGDVGLVADMQEEHKELVIGGTLQQKLTSCLEVMDVFLKQEEPVVSSMVVAEKKGGMGDADNVIDAVLNILGVKEIKQISLHSTLAELGMDSMMAVEIKQTLEREFEVFLTPQDIRNMTFARLREITEEKNDLNANKTEDSNELPDAILLLLRNMGNEKSADIPIIKLESIGSQEKEATKVFLLPGLEGMSPVMEPLASRLHSHTYCLQFRYGKTKNNVNEIANDLLQPVLENLQDENFNLIAYSFGAVVALELAGLLEKEGRQGTIILIDGAPEFLNVMATQQLSTDSESEFETGILCALMSFYMPVETIAKLKGPLEALENMDERIKMVIENSPKNAPHSDEYFKQVGNGVSGRLRSVMNYQPNFMKLKSTVKLLRPINSSVSQIDNDYGLSKLCEKEVEVKYFEGNHLSILENQQVGEYLNELLISPNTIVTTKNSMLNISIESRSNEISIN